MSFGDHLEELRRRLLWGLAVPLPLAVLTFIFGKPLIEWLYQPLDAVLAAYQLPRRVQVLGPAEMLLVQLKLSMIAALVLSAPWILWQTWLFVRPGLYKHEKRFVHFLVPGSAVLTAAGVVLMYDLMLPVTLRVLVGFGASVHLRAPQEAQDPRVTAWLDSGPVIELRVTPPAEPRPGQGWLLWPQQELSLAVEGSPVEIIRVPQPGGPIISQEFRLTTYINFVLMLMLGIAIAFQMPLAILLLGWVGLVTADTLRARRKYAIFACAVVAAVITPGPDPWSMLLMLAPLVVLYELSILLLALVPASAVAEGQVLGRVAPWRRRPPGGPPAAPTGGSAGGGSVQ